MTRQGEWDVARSVESFLDDLHTRRGIDAVHLPRYRALTEAFLRARAGRPLDALDGEDVALFVEQRRRAGDSEVQLRAAKTAGQAFLHFVGGGGLVAALTPDPVSQSEAKSGETTLGEDMRRVLTAEGAAFALAISAPLALGVLSLGFTLLGWIIYYAALAATFFQILEHLARGRPGLPMGASEGLARSLGRGLVILLVGVIPPLVAWLHFEPTEVFDARAVGVVLAALLGAGLLPAATLAVYASGSALAALAPHLWWRIVTRIPRAYAQLALLFCAAIVLRTLYRMLVGALLGSYPVLAGLVYAPPAALMVFVLAAALGGVVWRERDELGV